MKILQLISSGGMYGAEAVILNLMRVLREGPHASALGVFLNESQPNMQLYERALEQGVETYAIQCRGQFDPRMLRSLRELVRHTGADLVHAHGYKADVYLYLAMRGQGIPLVSTCHTWYDNDLALRFYGALDRLMLRRFTKVAAVSEQVRQRLLKAGVRDDRIALVRNGIDLRAFSQITPDAPAAGRPLRVGLVGRLEQEKGVDLFLRAAARVLAVLPLARFVVAGDGPDREKLQQLIAELGISENAALLGRQEDMPAFYASLDLLVSSSRQEGLPIALLEGMASGLPLVATAVGAVPDVVRHGKTGLLVGAQDVSALAEAMLELLQSQEIRLGFGVAARELVAQEFSAERMTGDYVRLYEQARTELRNRAV